jgi:hypothetical protein
VNEQDGGKSFRKSNANLNIVQNKIHLHPCPSSQIRTLQLFAKDILAAWFLKDPGIIAHRRSGSRPPESRAQKIHPPLGRGPS